MRVIKIFLGNLLRHAQPLVVVYETFSSTLNPLARGMPTKSQPSMNLN